MTFHGFHFGRGRWRGSVAYTVEWGLLELFVPERMAWPQYWTLPVRIQRVLGWAFTIYQWRGFRVFQKKQELQKGLQTTNLNIEV